MFQRGWLLFSSVYVFIFSLVSSACCVSLLPSFPSVWLHVLDMETVMVHMLATGPFTLQSGLVPHLQSGLASDQPTLLHLQPTSLGSLMSSLLKTCDLSAMILTNLALADFFICFKKTKKFRAWCQIVCSGMWAALSPIVEQSRAWLACVPGQPSVSTVSPAQPKLSWETFAGVNGPSTKTIMAREAAWHIKFPLSRNVL